MNRLPVAKRAQILQMLCEGTSMRATSRMADVSINTVSKLLVDAGRVCAGVPRRNGPERQRQAGAGGRNLGVRAAKKKNVTPELREKNPLARRRLDVDGHRRRFEADNRPTLSVRGTASAPSYSCATWNPAYWLTDAAHDRPAQRLPACCGRAFGADVDYAMLHKVYASSQDEKRYSPADCIGTKQDCGDWRPGPEAHLDVATWNGRT